MALGETIIEVPVPKNVPPQLPEYQFHAAPEPKPPPLTESVVDCPGQIGFNVVPMLVGAEENGFIVKVTSDIHTPNVARTVIVPGAVAVKVDPPIVPVPVPPTIDQVGVGLLCGPPRTYDKAFVAPLQISALDVVFVIVVFCL